MTDDKTLDHPITLIRITRKEWEMVRRLNGRLRLLTHQHDGDGGEFVHTIEFHVTKS